MKTTLFGQLRGPRQRLQAVWQPAVSGQNTALIPNPANCYNI